MEDIKDLLVKYIAGSASPEERSRVEDWIGEDPSHLKDYLALEHTWRDAGLMVSPGAPDAGLAYEKLSRKLGWQEKKIIRRIRPVYKVAAALGGVVLVSGIIYLLAGKWKGGDVGTATQDAVQVVVPRAHKKRLVLPDSTEVWLNAGSTLRIEPGFGIENRNVFLEGEGYFKVRHNHKLVFTVSTPHYTIRDIGTAFNVNTYPGDSHFEAAVLEGEISVEGHFSRNDKISRIVLSYNQVLKIRKAATGAGGDSLQLAGPAPGGISASAGGIAQRPDSTELIVSLTRSSGIDKYAGWKDDRLSFENESLRDIANRLERKYDLTIKIEDPGLAAWHYTGSFKGLNDIGSVLSILQETTPFVYEIRKDTVLLKSVHH